MTALYTTSATAVGGREGRAVTDDGRLDIKLAMPEKLAGRGGEGTNPEQLFACGYAACFESAVRLCAHRARLRVGKLSITATVEIHSDPTGDRFRLAVKLAGSASKLSTHQLAALMQQAHAICPYSNATRGNIQVQLSPSTDIETPGQIGVSSAVRTVTSERLRHVLGHFPTGVTIVTGFSSAEPVGMAANSFTSVSLNPPLVLICPGRNSETWPQIRAGSRFCVNVMADQHAELTRRFSLKGIDRFADVEWDERSTGPALRDALAWIECAIRDEHEAGDHTIVVADVLAIDVADTVDPLVFWRGEYGTFLARAAGSEA